MTRPNKKVTVYVKHYLTPGGMIYFQQEWFPRVHSILSTQPGFISLTQHMTGACAHLCLKFDSSTTFDAWLAHPSHDSLVDALDVHRDRDYWEAVRTDDEKLDPSELEWTKLKPRNNP